MSRELNVTYSGGRIVAAYLYLRQLGRDTVADTRRAADGMLVDCNAAGEPLGIEFIAPTKITLAGVDELLRSVGQEPSTADELWPLLKHTQGADAAA